MTRTQILLPDNLYRQARQLAEQQEVSLAHIVRRALEYLLMVDPPGRPPADAWRLDPPADTGLRTDPFANPDWRETANLRPDDTRRALRLKTPKRKRSSTP